MAEREMRRAAQSAGVVLAGHRQDTGFDQSRIQQHARLGRIEDVDLEAEDDR